MEPVGTQVAANVKPETNITIPSGIGNGRVSSEWHIKVNVTRNIYQLRNIYAGRL